MIFDFILVLLFFITFKFYGIYTATVAIIIGATVQVIYTRVRHGRFDKKQLLVLAVVLIFGSMTLYFHNPIFIKWKPTVVFWVMGAALLVSQFMGKKPLIERLMGHVFEGKETLPARVWKNLNIAWTVFFIVLGSVNVFVAYYFSDDAWVNFKLYGVLSALILFGVAQSFYLAKYLTSSK
jgi:intracellular septation protein